jgi:hypothetical protein
MRVPLILGLASTAAGCGVVEPEPTLLHHGEMWISRAELMSLPMLGTAWNEMKAAADGDLGAADLSGFTNDHDVKTLAVALVWARTGVASYRQKARDAIMSAIGTEINAITAVQPARNTVSYVLAADLIQLSELDPSADATFCAWLDQLRYVVWPDGSIVGEDNHRANNHGRMAGATRAAIAVYLGDQDEVHAAAAVFYGFLGNRYAYDDFHWTRDSSWQADQRNPVGINPVGATIDGFPVDGALPEEMRRGCSFTVPPCQTGYPWEALQGAFTEAVILSRAGYDVFNWEDKALLRAVLFVERLQSRYPGTQWWATGDDTSLPWLVNKIYGTSFPTEPANNGKCLGWTDWTHAPSRHPQPPQQSLEPRVAPDRVEPRTHLHVEQEVALQHEEAPRGIV